MILAAMMVPAMAAVEMDNSISVSGLMENDAYKLYQVLTWNQDAGEWQLAAGFNTVDDYNTTLFPADDKESTSRAQEIVKAIVEGLSQDQVNAIADITAKSTGAPSTKTTGTISTADSGTFQYAIASATDTSTLGLYMAIITAGTPEYVCNPVFVAADFDETNTTTTIDASAASYGEGIAKRQRIDLTKTTSDSNGALQPAINSYVGQEVTFDVNTTIPVFLDSYKHPYPALAEAGIAIRYNAPALLPPNRGKFAFQRLKNVPIGVIKVFPGIQFDLFDSIMTERLKGIVIETFGAGNIPGHADSLLPIIRKASDNGTVIVVCSQCPHGTVSLGAYEASSALKEAGAVSGYDITTEAAVAKLYCLFSRGLNRDEIRARMERGMRGKITV